MDIKEIMKMCQGDGYFFDPDTLRFFGQTLEGFIVSKMNNGKFMISQPINDQDGHFRGMTVRYYNPKTRGLEFMP